MDQAVPSRGPYRSGFAAELAAIEERRAALGVTMAVLAERAEIDVATYRRMRRTGLAFRRQVQALRMALRAIEGERRRHEHYFPVER